jgi:colicin import membrane protein
MTQLIKINPNEFGLEEKQAETILSGLQQILAEREILAQNYSSTIELEITEANIPVFKELRRKIADNRTKGIEKWHKVNKEFYLRGGQFVDAIKRKEIAENERMETNLLECEKHFENLEKKRLQELHESRAAQLTTYEVENVNELNLSTMTQDVFDAFLDASRNKYAAKLEAAARAEAERLSAIEAEKARIEAQRIENERLKAEAEAREKELEIERKKQAELLAAEKAKADAVRKEAEESARIEREKQEAILAQERAEKAKLEAELKAKADAEAKAEAERKASQIAAEKEAAKLAKAPIKKQLIAWVDTFELPPFATENETAQSIFDKFEGFKKWAANEINNI